MAKKNNKIQKVNYRCEETKMTLYHAEGDPEKLPKLIRKYNPRVKKHTIRKLVKKTK